MFGTEPGDGHPALVPVYVAGGVALVAARLEADDRPVVLVNDDGFGLAGWFTDNTLGEYTAAKARVINFSRWDNAFYSAKGCLRSE